MPIPLLQEDGLLLPGLYLAEMNEIEERFGKSTPRWKELFKRLRMFVELAQYCGALRMFVNGSFVTAKPEPSDVDVVIWVGARYIELLDNDDESAKRLKKMFDTRVPKDALQAIDEQDWEGWVWFFSGLRENPTKQKGLVEIELT
jgi:hypothetical protein